MDSLMLTIRTPSSTQEEIGYPSDIELRSSNKNQSKGTDKLKTPLKLYIIIAGLYEKSSSRVQVLGT